MIEQSNAHLRQVYTMRTKIAQNGNATRNRGNNIETNKRKSVEASTVKAKQQ